jgi:AcrR family transcriptional regulator
MTSIRHKQVEGPGPDDPYLDAARATILAVGWRRSTLTDVARRAGVSRMTIYRRWPDMQGLLADLMVREWGALVGHALDAEDRPLDRRTIAEAVVACLSRIRDDELFRKIVEVDELFRKIVEVDPDLLLPYLIERRGRTQDLVLDVLSRALADGQHRTRGAVRAGDPVVLAGTLLLTLHGFLVSAPTMTPDLATLDVLDAELTDLIERYLRP